MTAPGCSAIFPATVSVRSPAPAFTIWLSTSVVAPIAMAPLFEVIPERAATLSIWLLGGVPVPVSSSGPTEPTVRFSPSSLNEKLFCEPVP